MSRSNDHALFRTIVAVLAFAGLAACSGPDPTKFACSSSAECPSGYHCDLGTATTAGSLHCASGAPQQKTITVDATKFLLTQAANADGTVRTTITADVGAVTSTPDFVGLRAIASQGGADLASSQVAADGSVLQFQLPRALLQVDLRVQDDSGHSVTVTGYREHLDLTFLGKDVATNSNGMAAYDAVSASDSLYPPQVWTSPDGGVPTAVTELPRTYTVLADGGLSPPASYQAIEQLDGVNSATASAPQPDRDGGTPLGWEQLTIISTTTTTAVAPPARVGAAFGSNGSVVAMYGGAAPDVDGGVVDPAGTWYTFNPNGGSGWTTVQQPTVGSSNPFPSTSFGSPGVAAPTARVSTAMGNGATLSCTPQPCAYTTTHRVMVAGGTGATGALTDHIYAYGDKVQTFAGGSNTWTGWWDVTAEFGNTAANKLAVPNAGMAYAPISNIPQPVSGTSSQQHAGAVLVGGVNIPAGAAATAWDSIACQVVVGLPFSTVAGTAGTVANCTTAEFATLAGAIGFRSGVSLAASDLGDSVVYLFGGQRTGATLLANNGFKNDVWQLTMSVVCSGGGSPPCISPAVSQFKATWTAVPVAASPLPPARTNAGLGFADFRRLTVYGGTDSSGNTLNDVWELDLAPLSASPAGTPQWRQVALDPSPALAPAPRTKFSFIGNIFYNSFFSGLLFSGLVSSTPTTEVWSISKQAPARMIIKAPVQLPRLDLARNMTLGVLSFGSQFADPLYIWDGSAWRYVANPTFPGGMIFATLPNATGFIQADGNVYLMYMQRSRSVPGFSNLNSTIALDTVQVSVDFN